MPYGEVFGLYSGIATGREMLEYLDSKWRQYAATAQLWEDQGGRLINSEEPPLYVFDNMVLQKKLNQSGAGLPYSLPGDSFSHHLVLTLISSFAVSVKTFFYLYYLK